MKTSERKKLQVVYAKENVDFLFGLLETRFRPDFDVKYVKDIQRLSQGFNIKLSREEKLKFCRKCLCFFDVSSREIRFNSDLKAKEVICKNCGDVRRFRYK